MKPTMQIIKNLLISNYPNLTIKGQGILQYLDYCNIVRRIIKTRSLVVLGIEDYEDIDM